MLAKSVIVQPRCSVLSEQTSYDFVLECEVSCCITVYRVNITAKQECEHAECNNFKPAGPSTLSSTCNDSLKQQ